MICTNSTVFIIYRKHSKTGNRMQLELKVRLGDVGSNLVPRHPTKSHNPARRLFIGRGASRSQAPMLSKIYPLKTILLINIKTSQILKSKSNSFQDERPRSKIFAVRLPEHGKCFSCC